MTTDADAERAGGEGRLPALLTGEQLDAIRRREQTTIRYGIGGSANPAGTTWLREGPAATIDDLAALLGHIDALYAMNRQIIEERDRLAADADLARERAERAEAQRDKAARHAAELEGWIRRVVGIDFAAAPPPPAEGRDAATRLPDLIKCGRCDEYNERQPGRQHCWKCHARLDGDGGAREGEGR